MTKLVFKYWQFIFEYYSSVLALNVDCSPELYMWVSPANNNCTDSNLETWEVTVYKLFIISWSNTDPVNLCALTAHQTPTSKVKWMIPWTAWRFSEHQSCCLHSHLYKPYLTQEKHKFQIKKSTGNWFLNLVIPACYFPFEGKNHCTAVILYECTLTALFPRELRILTTGTKISWGLFLFECQYFFSVGTQCVFSFCPPLNLSLRCSTVLYTVLVHNTADAGIVFTKLLATFFLWCTLHKHPTNELILHQNAVLKHTLSTFSLQLITHVDQVPLAG